mgnify:FL=1|jgi:predicted permease
MALAALMLVVGAVAVSWAFFAIFKLPQQSFLTALSMPNMGNIGLPLALFTFGEKGLALAIAIFAILAIT